MTGGQPASEAARAGLFYVLGATAIAGAIGYIIQGVVPGFVEPEQYVAFSVFWATVYLFVSALSGVQQEVTRAAAPLRPGGSRGWPVLWRYACAVAVIVAIAVAASSPLWANATFGDSTFGFVAALIVAVAGYAIVAVMSGALYGLGAWPAIAGLTVTDAVLRLTGVVVVLAAGLGLVGLSWAVALPFTLAAAALWLVVGKRVRREIGLDVGMRGLAHNSLSTVGAAVSTGVLISGLPLLLQLTLTTAPTQVLASLMLVITLTRAPLVVPLLALQSFLLVTFRDAPARTARRLLAWGGGLAAATLVLAALAAWIGPWLLDALYGGRYELTRLAIAAIVIGGGAAAGLCLTGPAVLARSQHFEYVLGWAAASISVVLLLLLPLDPVARALVALCLGPLVGIAVHVIALRRAPKV